MSLISGILTFICVFLLLSVREIKKKQNEIIDRVNEIIKEINKL